jgi:hypothetical protein
MQSLSSSRRANSIEKARRLARVAHLFTASAFAIFGAAQESQAQNLVIANARIIVGNGQVIEHGGILVRDGRIAAVVARLILSAL